MLDDEEEECIPIPRRSLVHRHQKYISSDHETSPSNHRQSRLSLNNSTDLDDSIPTPKQLIDLYERTIDLAAKNQINIKNAFQISLVERLPEVLNLVGFDDQFHSDPNFVKVGSIIDTSAKIYGFRVDALHNETQRLSESIQSQVSGDEQEKEDEDERRPTKKSSQHFRLKSNSFLVSDLSTISISNEFQFHPLQPSHMCKWSGGVGFDSIYADMVSYTMYSASDFALVHGFVDLNSRINMEYMENDRLLDLTTKTMLDMIPLREVIKENEGENHILGCPTLREFSFNEETTESYIETIDECSIIDSLNEDDDDDEEEHILSDIRDEPTSFYFPELQSTYTCALTMPSVDMTFLPTKFSFVDHVPYLLHEKNKQSDYTYFDPIKLKLFAGPYVWKYTNLLPNSLNNQPTIIRHHQSTKSTRTTKIDFFSIQSVDKLMSIHTRSKSIRKSSKATSLSHQLRLTRKIYSIDELLQLNHFPNMNLDEYDIDDNMDEENYIPDVVDPPMDYDFIRPIHYEKIECEKNLIRIDAKKLQHDLLHEYKKECSSIEFSNLCLNLIEKNLLSSEKSELISAFYCMLNNCNKTNLFMKSNIQQDDLFIQNQPFQSPTIQLTYAHQFSF